jgi:hypothetical protein
VNVQQNVAFQEYMMQMFNAGMLPQVFPAIPRQFIPAVATNEAKLFGSDEEGKEEGKVELYQEEEDRGDQGLKATSKSGKSDGKIKAK